MNKTINRQKGFAAIELVLIIVVIVLLGAMGYLVYKNHKKTVSVTTSPTAKTVAKTTTPAPADPYASWKVYTTQYQKAALKYPSDWQLSDTSNSDGSSKQDLLTLKSPDGFSLTLQSLIPLGAAGSDVPLLGSDSVTFAGNSDFFLFYASRSTTSLVGAAVLSTSKTNIVMQPTKNSSDTVWDISMTPAAPITQTALAASQAYKNAKLILQSVSY